MPVLWWVELSLFPLKGRATSGGVFWHVCELSTTLGSLYADGWGCVPVLLVFGVRCPALEPEGSCVGPDLGVDMDTSGTANTD